MLATFTVSNTQDSGFFGELREAIGFANATPGVDTITFESWIANQTILLTSGELPITESVVIDGGGYNITIDAAQSSRIFGVYASSGSFTFQDLNLVNGISSTGGGAIYAPGPVDVVIENCELVNNSAAGFFSAGGAVYTSGNLILSQSMLSDNSTNGLGSSGGAAVATSMVVSESTISGNSTLGESSVGGGLAASNLTIVNSTVSGNSTSGINSRGGGIYAYELLALNSTISGNWTANDNSGGGGLAVGARATLLQCTVTENSVMHAGSIGGGIAKSFVSSAEGDQLILGGTIVAENSVTAGTSVDLAIDPGDNFISAFSLLGVVDGLTIDTNVGSLTGSFATPLDPLLAHLNDNGGKTLTHALLPGSPAIEAGDPSQVFSPTEFDQRGTPFPRVIGRVDIGAYEFAGIPSQGLIVDTLEDTIDGNFSPGDLSLREAALIANGNPGANTITFSTTLSGSTLLLSGSEIEFTDGVTVDASMLIEPLTIDAQELSRIFNITSEEGDYSVRGLTLIRGRTTGDNTFFIDSTYSGGAIRSMTTGELILENCIISDNAMSGSSASGGGVFAMGDVTLTSTIISNNSAENGDGGGLFGNANITITDSTISGNIARYDGGGLVANQSGYPSYYAVLVTNSTISGNQTFGTAGAGGGIYSFCPVTIIDSTISGNSTSGTIAFPGANDTAGGGAIYCPFDEVTVIRSTISNNSTTGDLSDGGAINSRAITLIDSTISNNLTAGESAAGGALITRSMEVYQSTISGNRTTGGNSRGGGVFASTTINISSSTITDNHTTGLMSYGGAIAHRPSEYLGYEYPLAIENSIIAGNSAAAGDNNLSTNELSDVTINYSLIGTGIVPTSGDNNIVSDLPMLGPLQDNGGPTWTHALLPGSPAIDAGDPAAVAGENGVPLYDQRGMPFERVRDGDAPEDIVIDIGAFEVQEYVPPATGDFDNDGDVDGRDFLKWQRGESPRPLSSEDLELWQEEYDSGPLAALAASSNFETKLFASKLLEADEFSTEFSPLAFLPIKNDDAEDSPLTEAEQLVASYPTTVDSAIERLFASSPYSAYESTDIVVSRLLKRRR